MDIYARTRLLCHTGVRTGFSLETTDGADAYICATKPDVGQVYTELRLVKDETSRPTGLYVSLQPADYDILKFTAQRIRRPKCSEVLELKLD
jgi:hypothetical protein